MIQTHGHLWRQIQRLSLIGNCLPSIKNRLQAIRRSWEKIDQKIVNSKLFLAPQDARILVASNEPLILEQFGALVGSSSPRIISCAELSDDLKHQPAAVFLDVTAPGISQQQLDWLIRDRTIAAAAPIVLLTNEVRLCQRWNTWDTPYCFLLRPTTEQNLPQFRAGIQRIFYELGLSF